MKTISYCISIVIGQEVEHKFVIEEFLIKNVCTPVHAWGGGVTPIDWNTGCAIFLGYFFGWKINFWVKILVLNKFLGQVFMKH